MQSLKSFETKIRDIIIDVCEVLYRNGYESVTLGSLMRLIGIDNESAKRYDNEIYNLNQDFELLLELKRQGMLSEPELNNVLH